MNTKDNSGPAFPCPTFTMTGYPNGHSMGMTLRDWFAGQALAGMLACPTMRAGMESDEYAKASFQCADAMLEARK